MMLACDHWPSGRVGACCLPWRQSTEQELPAPAYSSNTGRCPDGTIHRISNNSMLIWLASFLLGISTFAPLEALCLGVDYYNSVFEGQQVAVRAAASYDAALTLTQAVCYWLDTRQSTAARGTVGGSHRLSSIRIITRHAAVTVLLVLLIVYAQFAVTEGTAAPTWALGVMILIAALIGLLDGTSLGAVYGEVGIIGPSSAHAVVAGHACGFLLLAVLRVFSKAVVAETPSGLKQSFCLFFGTTALLLLMALAGYLRVVRPAVLQELHQQRSAATNTAPKDFTLDTCHSKPTPNTPYTPSIWNVAVKIATATTTLFKKQPVEDDVVTITELAATGCKQQRVPAPTTDAVSARGDHSHDADRQVILAVGVPLSVPADKDVDLEAYSPEYQEFEVPKYCRPGVGVLSITRTVLKDHWQFAIAIWLSYCSHFLIFPAVLAYVHWPAVGSWYPLLLQLADGCGDLAGKLLPVWHPPRPKFFLSFASTARAVLLVPAFVMMLYWDTPPAAWICLTFLWSLTGWFESLVFSLSCDDLHPDDAYQVESLLAFFLQLGSVCGAVLSLLLDLGPWAAAAAAAAAGGDPDVMRTG